MQRGLVLRRFSRCQNNPLRKWSSSKCQWSIKDRVSTQPQHPSFLAQSSLPPKPPYHPQPLFNHLPRFPFPLSTPTPPPPPPPEPPRSLPTLNPPSSNSPPPQPTLTSSPPSPSSYSPTQVTSPPSQFTSTTPSCPPPPN